MGASAAFNIAASYETILSSILPGLSYEEDARFGYLNLSRQARKLPQARNGLCVAMGFGGINAAVVIGRDLGD
jgi:3-oxoacyl-(acyl-carrier-protein) synthase